ncbi:MAG: choice-of-anchor Q domain-containing protein [Solirubrobacteraceae bacterium]
MVNATIAANLVGGPGNPGTGPLGTGGPGDAGMGGGISAYGSITSQNTLVSGNSGTNCLGVVTDHGHNLSFPDNSCPGTNGDPMLGPLADNGGPTQTMALGAGSAAIDQVPATGAGCPATDQRGVSRPQGAACDIGAFEAALPSNTAPPMITGSATVGAMLMCSNGTWANFPQSFAYAWLQDGTPIAGAAGDTYIVSSADVGRGVACQVTATNQTGSASAPSASLSIPAGGSGGADGGAGGAGAGGGGGSGGTGGASGAPRLSGLVVHPNTFVAALSGRRTDAAGANRFHFTGRLNGSALRPGSYRLAVSAAVGRSVSVTEHAGFVIKPRRRAG